MLKKLLAALAALALVAGLLALVASPANAHIPAISASCAAGVSVNLTSYNNGHLNGNQVTVTMDGRVRDSQNFGETFLNTYAWTSIAATHTWEVVVSAWDDPTGSQGWSVDQKGSVTGCETEVTPAAATSTNPYCTAAGVVGGGGYTIPTEQNGVQYQLWDGSKWADIASGAYAANPGAVIKIHAIATAGYTIKPGVDHAWTFTLTAPDASTCVVPTPPTSNPAECTSGSSTTASYTVPKTPAGYFFFLQGSNTPISSTSQDVTITVTTFPTTIVIVAKTNGDFRFPVNTKTTWTFDFGSPGDCRIPVAPADVVPQYAACTTPNAVVDNGYIVTETAGVTYQIKDGANWTTITAYGLHDLGSAASAVDIRAIASDAQHVLTGTVDWPFTFAAAHDCPVPAGDPVFVDGTCESTHPGSALLGSYTVIRAEHVHYVASVNGSTPPTPLIVGVANQAQPGDVVVITPIADVGYVISPVIAAENLTHTFLVSGNCLVKADFVKPDATSQSCVVAGKISTLVPAFITIPGMPHVQYFINDVRQTTAGDVTLPPATYKVSAAAETGYFLQGYNGPWTEVLASAQPCGDLITHPLVLPLATQVQLGCFTSGSYTLSNSINDTAVLTWTVNGATVSPGTFHVSSDSTVVVHAMAKGPAYGLEAGATTDWTFHFVRPTRCDLTTLALTGSTPLGWIGVGYAMLVCGLALIAVRYARRRDEQA
ncbi:MAG TPA: hypothetical protein VFQ74_06070 [Pseudolysinimonas sp.]|nr:hypothetical protein [Pseudolysinimonas sp.]